MITKARSLLALVRRSLSQDNADARIERPAREGPAAVLALISVIVIAACVGAAIALTQIRSLKSEIAALQRELAPLKERVAQLDQAARRQAEQQQHADDKSAIGKNRFGETQAALNLSSEEIQLVKVYIRPAPSTGAPAGTMKVGDIVESATIPLPSPLTEKIPRLVGARFAIRNGAIIIVRKGSHQADAVLEPN